MRPITLASALLGATLALPALAQNASPPLVYVQPLPPQAVQAVQQRLAQTGLYQGRIDGVWGSDSEAALQRFQQNHQLQVTGSLNEATARNLGLNPNTLVATAQPPANATAAATPATLSPSAIRSIQDRLRYLGFYQGGIDGVWGPETQAAFSQYQARNGLQVTGEPNSPTLRSLGFNPETMMAGQ
jgi:peptidoglycan hydrolase-like protein with peptidoglycan-binding domain